MAVAEADELTSFLARRRFSPKRPEGVRVLVIVITDEQRRVLVEHALDCNWSYRSRRRAAEDRFADVIVDLAADRPVADRDLLVAFLWRRLSLALEAGPSRRDHWVWSAAVQVLDQLGEDLEDIFTGRPIDGLRDAQQTELR